MEFGGKMTSWEKYKVLNRNILEENNKLYIAAVHGSLNFYNVGMSLQRNY